MMAWVGLACFVKVSFIPVLHEVIHPGARRVFTKRFFKAVRMSSILPDAPLLLVLFSGWPGERYNMEKPHPGDILYCLG